MNGSYSLLPAYFWPVKLEEAKASVQNEYNPKEYLIAITLGRSEERSLL